MGIIAEEYTELIDTVVTMLDDPAYDAMVPVYLSAAMEAILTRRFPMDASVTWEDTDGRYDMKACMIAVQLINKRGAEGEIRHEDNGIVHTFRSADVPTDMLRGIVPLAGVPR